VIALRLLASLRVLALGAFISAVGSAQEREPKVPCAELVSSVVLQFVGDAPYADLARIEIRRCDRAFSGTLQIVGWERKATQPAFTVETTDFTLVQFAMLGSVTLIETAGGTVDRVYIVVYQSGKLRVQVQRTTKDRARLTSNDTEIRVFVPNTWTGKTESFAYPNR
jgi:hypothetical protein